MRAQMLVPTSAASSAFDVVQRVIIQAQDAKAARLGIRARSKDLTEADVERERLHDRSYVRAWAMRGTIHLITSEDYPWIRDLVAAPLIRQSLKRLAQEGMSQSAAERARPVVRKLLENGPAGRAEIREVLAKKNIKPKGRQALVHLLFVMTYEGEVVTGPYVDGKETVVLADDWIHKRPKAPKDPAVELARRYILAYGPASIDDFRWWSGLPAARARTAWAAMGDELVDHGDGLHRHRSQGLAAGRAAPTRLLPMWDHYFLGYKDRSHAGTSKMTGGASAGGIFHPLVVADGKATGLWRLTRKGTGFNLSLEPLEGLPSRASITREVADLSRFLGQDVKFA
ncbi:MAG: winged helix DNA-binding domain-containing protein [Actinomycetota bacterium]